MCVVYCVVVVDVSGDVVDMSCIIVVVIEGDIVIVDRIISFGVVMYVVCFRRF